MTAQPATPKIIVITGPSAVGKGTLIKRLRAALPELIYSISTTTRAMRPGEENGVQYYFVDRSTYQRMVDNDEFAEHAEFAGNLYGTTKAELARHIEAGNSVILEIEVQGAEQLRQSIPTALQIFIKPPSLASLSERIRQRGTDSEAEVAKRLAEAEREVAQARHFHYQIVNEDLEIAANELIATVKSELGQD